MLDAKVRVKTCRLIGKLEKNPEYTQMLHEKSILDVKKELEENKED